jgi:hypothetical protein
LSRRTADREKDIRWRIIFASCQAPALFERKNNSGHSYTTPWEEWICLSKERSARVVLSPKTEDSSKVAAMAQLLALVFMSILAAILALCAMGIIRAWGKRAVGFRPTWPTGIGSCLLGYLISLVGGGVWGRLSPTVDSADHIVRALIVYVVSLAIYPFLHKGISVNGGGHKPTSRQAFFLAAVQAATGFAASVAASFLGQALKAAAARSASL